MQHGIVIYPGKPEESFIASLHAIRNVKWQVIFPSEDADISATFDEMQPAYGNLVIVLDPACTTFGYLSALVRNGCHLFLTENQRMTYEEKVKLNQLAEEGNTYIQIRNDLLFHPSFSAATGKSQGLKLLEIHHFAPDQPDRLQEMMYSNLQMILKIADSEPNRLSVCAIPDPENQAGLVNLHLNFHNGSAASLTFSFNGDKKEHLLSVHSAQGATNYNFIEAISCMGEFGNRQLIRQIAGFEDTIQRKNHHRYYLSEEARTFQLIEKINQKLEFNSVLV
ncbi:MAG TPA: hypothetical protein VIK10_08675 [Prolixibacteraceae bacterium]